MAPSSYYHHRDQALEAAESLSEDDQALEQRLIALFRHHSGNYGARRLVKALEREGFTVGRQRVRTLMGRNGLRAKQPKRFVPRTTQSDPRKRRSPNLLLEMAFEQLAPNQVWVADITYLPAAGGRHYYLSVWMDWCSRRIVGWAVADHMEASLVEASLQAGLRQRKPPVGLILHSDGGGQYTAEKVRRLIAQHGHRQSMTRRDNHYDNAHMESFFGRMKTEMLENGVFEHLEEARIECQSYIEAYYNRERLHSGIGYQTPAEYEDSFIYGAKA
jgi:transposase InsO family protein